MKKKKKYQKPKVIHRQNIEVLALVCSSAWAGTVPCMTTAGGCPKPRD